MRENRRVVFLLCMLSIILMAAIPFAAQASAVHYGAGGDGYDSNGKKLLGYGTYALSYLYPNQSPLDGEYWVNSLYARRDDMGTLEAGWNWTRNGTLQWFMVRYNALTQVYEERVFNGYYNTTGTWVPIHLRQRYDGTNNDDWQVSINGSIRYVWYNTGTTSARPSVGAERYDTRDYNKGSWKNISYLYKISNTQFEWRNWVRSAATPVGTQQDPNYRYYGDKMLPAYNYWVYVDAN